MIKNEKSQLKNDPDRPYLEPAVHCALQWMIETQFELSSLELMLNKIGFLLGDYLEQNGRIDTTKPFGMKNDVVVEFATVLNSVDDREERTRILEENMEELKEEWNFELESLVHISDRWYQYNPYLQIKSQYNGIFFQKLFIRGENFCMTFHPIERFGRIIIDTDIGIMLLDSHEYKDRIVRLEIIPKTSMIRNELNTTPPPLSTSTSTTACSPLYTHETISASILLLYNKIKLNWEQLECFQSLSQEKRLLYPLLKKGVCTVIARQIYSFIGTLFESNLGFLFENPITVLKSRAFNDWLLIPRCLDDRLFEKLVLFYTYQYHLNKDKKPFFLAYFPAFFTETMIFAYSKESNCAICISGETQNDFRYGRKFRKYYRKLSNAQEYLETMSVFDVCKLVQQQQTLFSYLD